MGVKEELQSEVRDIFATRWNTRDGNIVPEAEDVGLGNDSVKFDEVAILYADLAESTVLVGEHQASFAAEVYKAFLHCASKIVRRRGGEITAFDGDRIMAVVTQQIDPGRLSVPASSLYRGIGFRSTVHPA